MKLSLSKKTDSPGPAWDKDALAALDKVPFFVRPMVKKKVEAGVAAEGGGSVTVAEFKAAEERFRAIRAGKSEAELEAMLPRANRPGVEMVVIEACHGKLAGCPNALIDTDRWRETVGKWARDKGLAERLRGRVTQEKVLFHHKLKVSISGCPNGCSRPQIADFGLVGFVRPSFDDETCLNCDACLTECPDSAIFLGDTSAKVAEPKCQGCLKCHQACISEAISLSRPGVRLLLAGKLGRRPHLGRPVLETIANGELIDFMDAAVDDYVDNAPAGLRFADYVIGRRQWRNS